MSCWDVVDVSQPVPKVDSVDENKASRVLSMTGIGNNNFNGSGDENPIRQITDRGGAEIQSDNLQKPMVQMGADKMDPKHGQKPVISDNTPHIVSVLDPGSLMYSFNICIRCCCFHVFYRFLSFLFFKIPLTLIKYICCWCYVSFVNLEIS